MIDAPARPTFLSLFNERERRKVNVPARTRLLLANRARRAGGERRAWSVLLDLLYEAVRLAIGREAEGRLVGLALAKMAHAPRVGGVETVAHHSCECLLASAFQFDERLRLAVERERRRLAVAGGAELAARGNRRRILERPLARHGDVERDDGEGLRKVVDSGSGAEDRDESKENPESGALQQRLLLLQGRCAAILHGISHFDRTRTCHPAGAG